MIYKRVSGECERGTHECVRHVNSPVGQEIFVFQVGMIVEAR